MHRPYRIPIPDWAAALVVIPPYLGILLLFAVSNWYVYFFCAASVAFGLSLHKLAEVCKQRGWANYEESSDGGFEQEYETTPITPGEVI